MKHLLLTTIAAVLVVGCGESQQSATSPETKPAAEAATPEPPPEPPTAKAPDISIHDAAMRGNIEAVKQHIAAGTDVEAKDKDGWTPLHLAASTGRKEVSELLIAKDADVNAKGEGRRGGGGMTPLDLAVKFHKPEIVALLSLHGGKTGEELNVLVVAAKKGDIEAVKQHIAAGADVNAKEGGFENTPLIIAASQGHKEIAELLITNGADVNAKDVGGLTPLDWATGWLPFRNTPSETKAAKKEIADLLRKHGGKSGGEDSIYVAAKTGNIKAVKQHIAAGTDVNVRDGEGWTPLLRAAFWGHKEIVELLIAEGADVNANANDGKTPLDSAIRYNRPELADLLRKHGGK
ncbi:uncharacterized protein METZ01_LOCUS319933, partial [marine metagenome]